MTQAILTVTLDARSNTVLGKLVARLTPVQLMSAIFKLFQRLGTQAAAHVIKTQLSGPSAVLKTITGQLRLAVTGDAVMRAGVPGIRVGVFRGPALRYAQAQELGADIKPVNAKALAMPVGDALTPAGAARYQGPRQYPGQLKFIPFRGSGVAIGKLVDMNAYRAEQKRARASGQPFDPRAVRALYILLTKTTLKARHYLRNGLREFLPIVAPEIAGWLARYIAKGEIGAIHP